MWKVDLLQSLLTPDPLYYTHFGEIYKRLDMRAEIGLLTRNIRIQGEISPGQNNGGHMKVGSNSYSDSDIYILHITFHAAFIITHILCLSFSFYQYNELYMSILIYLTSIWVHVCVYIRNYISAFFGMVLLSQYERIFVFLLISKLAHENMSYCQSNITI